MEFFASSYQYIYMIIIVFFTFQIIRRYKSNYGNPQLIYPDNLVANIAIVLFFVFFVGLRPADANFTDMGAYSSVFRRYEGVEFFFNKDTDNLFFDNLIMWWASAKFGATSFFLLISTIYFVCAYIGIKKIFNTHILPAFVVFLAAFSTFSYATNGIKAGAAASIFICALGFWQEGKAIKKVISIALIIVSFGFHHSMQLPIAAFILVLLIKNPKYFYGAWCVSVVLAAIHVTYFQNLFGGLTDEQGAGYLIVDERHSTSSIRFRPDFILYSAFPVIIGYYYEIKKHISTKTYSFLIHLYTLLNTIWMLCMYAEFNNRIAYLSWFLYPIVIIYPYLYVDNSPKKYIYFSKAAKYHLYFTLFMVFVYYGMLGLGR